MSERGPRRALVAALLGVAACHEAGPPGSQGGLAEEYAPEPGATFEYVPEGAMEALYASNPDGVGAAEGLATLRVQATETTWELVEGEGRTASLPWEVTDEGLFVGGSHLLPPRTGEGEESAGVVVEAAGEYATWYGTFSEASTARVADGELSGEATLARFLGPVQVSFAGKVWELVYYERPTADGA